MWIRFVALFAMFCSCLSIFAQSSKMSSEILENLRSNRWQVRRDAFERIVADPKATSQQETQYQLIRLRCREDRAAEFSSEDLFEDDDYLAYDDQLTTLVQKIALHTNKPKAWRALAYMRYNGDSEYGRWLSQHWQALPFLVEQLKSPHAVRRATAVEVISLRLYYSKSAERNPEEFVRREEYRYLKNRIRLLARIDVAPVSQSACMGLGTIGDDGDISLLEEIAADKKRDKYTREFARQAIAQIRGDKHTIDRLRTHGSFN